MKKENILIVDDIKTNRLLLSAVISDAFNIDADEAANHNEALQLAKEKKYDIILLDIQMPGRDGFYCAEKILKTRKNKTSTIIFITAHDQARKNESRALKLGAVDFISKPIDTEHLERLIGVYLRFIRKEKQNSKQLRNINKNLSNEIIKSEELQKQLTKTKENFKSIVEKSEAAILIVDMEGIIKFINESGTEIFDRTKEELLGETFGLFGQSDSKTEINIVRKNGEIGIGELTTTKTNWEKKPAWLVLINDITDHKQLQKKLEEAKIKAQESDRLKSAFLSNMSHEIRTPMNGILGFLEFIEEEPDIEKRKQYSDIIKSSGNHLLNLINDIIDISKIEAGQLKITRQNVSIDDLMFDLYGFFNKNRQLLENKIKLILDVPEKEENLILFTDPHRLKQVMINLIANAIKFTDEGSIKFGYQLIKKKVRFFVKDTGRGIPEAMQNIIFSRFSQIIDSNAIYTQGTGLGLAISKSIVELLDGDIWLNSKLEKGSEFYFTLPLFKMENSSGKNSSSTPAISKTSPGKKDKILIVEDDDTHHQLLRAILENEGLNTDRVRTGQMAVEKCKTDTYDLVLMDIKLPEMDGLTATQTIKKAIPSLPVIAQTAYAQIFEKEKFLKAGCDEYVSKPYNKKELLTKVLKTLGNDAAGEDSKIT